MTEPKYEEILKLKIDYYGETKAAYQFAAEEFAREQVKFITSNNMLADSFLPTLTKKDFKQWITGAYGETIGIADNFDMEKCKKAVAFADEVIRFATEHKLLAKNLR